MRFFLIFILLFLPIFIFAQRIETTVLRGLSDGKVHKYETIEIGIRMPERENAYRNFLNPSVEISQLPGYTQINPYTEKFLRLQFICNGKTYIVPAFYMQDVVADEKINQYVTTETDWPWRVRFAVPDTGSWHCLALVGEILAQAIPRNAAISFQCIPGKNHGYLNVAPDRRHFQFTDGTLFFAIGQNIAWADEPILHGHPGPPPVYSAGYFDTYHYLENLADNGGNYVRIVMIYWSTGIEWERLGVYDQRKAAALDSMISIAEKRGLKVQLCLNMTGGLNAETAEENWSQYRKRFLGLHKTAIELFKDSAALSCMDDFIRYIHARWTFSPTVASIEFIGEGNACEGYDAHKNNFADFYLHAQKLLREEFGDTKHILSTSSSNTDHPEMYKNDVMSFIDMHHYDNNFKCNQKRYQYVQRNSKKMNKPFLFGEMGMINGPGNGADPDDYEHCNDVSFHNALWATTFMGAAGTGLNWWQWKFDVNREANIKPLRYFLDAVVGADLFYSEADFWSGNGLECFYQVNKKSDNAFGWVHNTSYWWGNMMQNCKDRNGKQMTLPKDDDEAATVENRKGNKFRIRGLYSRTDYVITFYDTRQKNAVISVNSLKTNLFGAVEVEFPAIEDCAFRIVHE
ncbi:hypothetical protein BH11BAC7_BH11BAC7_21830 [soil metagenome]